MNELIFEILKLIVMLCMVLVTGYVIPYIKRRVGADNLAVMEEWAEKAVLFAQQTMWENSGESRKEFVLKYLKDIAEQRGIKITDDQLEVLIEAAVKSMKIADKDRTITVPPISVSDTALDTVRYSETRTLTGG